MTRYDPYAFGEVSLNSEPKTAADPDDLLFAQGEDVKQAPPADSSWSLLEEQNVDDLRPGQQSVGMAEAEQFGADVLGELPPGPNDMDAAMPMAEPQTAESLMAQSMDYDAMSPPMGAPQPMAEPSSFEGGAQPSPLQQPADAGHEVLAEDAGRRAGRQSKRKSEEPAPLPRPSSELPIGRRNPLSAVAVPLALSVVGGTASSWVWVTLGNPVLAGIAAATTAVGALFSWLLLRG